MDETLKGIESQPGKEPEPDHLPRTVEELQEWSDKLFGVTNKEGRTLPEPIHKSDGNGSVYEVKFFLRVVRG